MSTNHNRIRVADLETNQPNKILKTNAKGELEFSDANNLQTENYNALDCTTEGKALDARQGKVLKDMIDNVSSSPISLVNDLTTGGTSKALTAEMGKQLNETKHPLEDQRLSQDQTVKFENVIVKDGKYTSTVACYAVQSFNNETYFSTKLTPDAIIANSSDARRLEVKYNSINFIRDPYTDKKGSLLTNYLTGARSWFLQDKDGTLALTNDFVNTAAGTSIRPPLMIPNGTLTSMPADGAIERDSSGKLWTTRNGVRYRLTEDDGSYVKIIMNGDQMILDTPAPYITTDSTKDTVLGTFKGGDLSNNFLGRLTVIANADDVIAGGGSIPPEMNKFQIVIKFTNALLSSSFWGPASISELVLIDDVNKTGTTTTLLGTRAGWDANVGLFNGLYAYDIENTSNPKNLSDVTAQIVCRRLVKFKDSTNTNNNNQAIRNYTNITSTLIERIRI